jgi:calcineurin-like phosphoesterase family protein
MNRAIIGRANMQASADDVIVHVGDLACFSSLAEVKPAELLKQVKATVVNIHGNHDTTNRVKSLCSSMRTQLGKKYTAVSVSHYPTYDRRAEGQFLEGDIHICGHVHERWQHCLDLEHKCLNINVGVDAWQFKMLSEDDLVKYIDKLLRDTSKLKRAVIIEGKVHIQ